MAAARPYLLGGEAWGALGHVFNERLIGLAERKEGQGQGKGRFVTWRLGGWWK